MPHCTEYPALMKLLIMKEQVYKQDKNGFEDHATSNGITSGQIKVVFVLLSPNMLNDKINVSG